MEEVAFISNRTLLNLSSEETSELLMFHPALSPLHTTQTVSFTYFILLKVTYRRAGEASPPPSPTEEMEASSIGEASQINTAGNNENIVRAFNGEGEMGDFMNQLMQQCLKNTGMEDKMKSMEASERLAIAEKIKNAKEGFLAKIMEETNKMEQGEKVITADVVQRCVAKMNPGY